MSRVAVLAAALGTIVGAACLDLAVATGGQAAPAPPVHHRAVVDAAPGRSDPAALGRLAAVQAARQRASRAQARHRAHLRAVRAAAARQAAAEAAARAAQARAEATGDTVWDRLAACESSGNWADTEGAYEGGVQFLNSTWLRNGGGRYATHAYDATRAEQITIAKATACAEGVDSWPTCGPIVGLSLADADC